MTEADCKFCGRHTPCVAGPMGVTICATCTRLAMDVIDELAGKETDESLAAQRDYAVAQVANYRDIVRFMREDHKAAAIVADLAAMDPFHEGVCQYCDAIASLAEPHDPICIWHRAREAPK